MGGITNKTVHLSFAVDWSKEVNPLLYELDLDLNDVAADTSKLVMLNAFYLKWIEGVITQVDMAMNPINQSFNADIVFDNPDALIKAGVTVDITITNTNQNKESITLHRNDLIKN